MHAAELLRRRRRAAASAAERQQVVAATASDSRAHPTLLVAENDITVRTAICRYLERMHYVVHEAADGPAALHSIFDGVKDLVILDLGLPGIDGAQVLAKIRRESAVPVIVCTARDSEEDRVRILNLGADDYLVKPFSFAELEARVRAVLRRGQVTPDSLRLCHGELIVDRSTRTVILNGEVVVMTRKEFDLLAFLAASPDRVFTREDLLERVWGSTEQWQGRSTVTEHIRRIRLKMDGDGNSAQWITTVRGMGYRFGSPRTVS
jgi:DNA-binding response OmpR family regulator